MLNTDEDALICDLAETYHIYDLKGLPLSKMAILSCGLRENSRIKMKLADVPISQETLIQAEILDQLAFIAWTKTEDAQNNQNRPKQVSRILLGIEEQKENESFNTVEDFEAMRRRIIEGINNG